MKRGRLCLTRKDGEQFIIGDDIAVTVVETRHGRTKLMIEAPRDMRIVRREIHDTIRQEAAAQ